MKMNGWVHVLRNIGVRRTLWLICDTLYEEPCTVRAVGTDIVRGGSVATTEGKGLTYRGNGLYA